MDKTTILKAFNNQFEEFLEDVELLFPDNRDIKTSKTGLLMLRKANPKKIVSVWYRYVCLKYEDEIEKEGVRRAQDVAHGADLCLVIFDGESWPDVDSSLQEYLAETARPSIGIVNKVDLLNQSHRFSLNSHDLFAISVKTGAGIDGFMEALEAALNDHYGDTEEALVTRLRHRESLASCVEYLARALTVSGSELWAEDLRLAMRELGSVVGQVGVEDLLDVIFSEFCIGK